MSQFSIIESALNIFSRPFTSGKGRGNRFVVFVIAVLALVICCWATLFHIPQKFVFMADSITFKDCKSVTIGENSDVNFQGVPHDYITVTPNPNGGASWKVAAQHRDTLQYFKINNSNPNAHDVSDDATDTIRITIPIVDKNGIKSSVVFETNGAEVWKEWSNFKKQNDVMARHFAVRKVLSSDSVSQADSALYLRQVLDNEHIRSFFHCKHGPLGTISGIQLVILDSVTKFNGKGYKYEGNVESNECKVQFYNVTSYCYSDGKSSKNFQISRVNYAMKPLVRLTEWGAGHVMLRMTPNGPTDVYFPKGIGYVGTVDSLRQYALNSTGVITFRQSCQSYPGNSDIFLPYFSHNINEDLFNLEFDKEGSQLTVRDNHSALTKVSNPSSYLQLIPALQKVDLQSGRTVVHSRIGYIDKPFMLRYMLLPLLVLLVLLFLTLSKWSPLRRGDDCYGLYAQDEIESLPSHVAMLSFVAFVFCACKSMIALKLSYSFPYFEKLTVITPFNCAMMLLVFFTLMLILNSRITTYSPRGSRRKTSNAFSRWLTCGTLVVVCSGLCYTLFCMSDRQIAGDVIASYFPSEINFIANWVTNESAFGTLDNHRTVSYALIVVEALLLGILALIYYSGVEWVDRITDKVGNVLAKMIPASVRSKCNTVWDAVIGDEPLPMLKPLCTKVPKQHGWKREMAIYRNKVISHVPAVLVLLALFFIVLIFDIGTILAYGLMTLALLVFFFDFVHDAFLATLRELFPLHYLVFIALFIIGNFLGNFGTAFITLTVLLGLPKALSSVRFTDPSQMQAASLPRQVVFCEMIFISLFYMIAAMVADNGYLTNYIGFILAIICFYFIRLRPGKGGHHMTESDQKEHKWVQRILIGVALLAVFLPNICGYLVDPEDIDYSRMTRRVVLFSDFDNLQRVGYRYVESDSEFMVVMSHYMQMKDGGDPLSNDTHFLHASVSTGQSPVVLNDLSVPVAFFGTYGLWAMTAVYFMLIFALLKLVLCYMFDNMPERPNVYLTWPMQWRLLAVMMWAGTSFYIYFSYLGVLPFTGRLNPGYGVDAVGEALETAVLLAFMAVTTTRDPKTKIK